MSPTSWTASIRERGVVVRSASGGEWKQPLKPKPRNAADARLRRPPLGKNRRGAVGEPRMDANEREFRGRLSRAEPVANRCHNATK